MAQQYEYAEEVVGKDAILATCQARGEAGWRLAAAFGVALAGLVETRDRSASPGAVLLFEREKAPPESPTEG